MVASPDRNYMSPQEYLEWEERQEIKYEYIDGEVFAMTGETLQEYVLIDAEKIGLDCFRLNDRGLWELHPYEEGDEVHLTSADFHFPISLVYEDVQFVGKTNRRGAEDAERRE
ncbi:hypothetical protein [Nostoc punctiforme]|uniref:Uncharacterized protein n=1 Tax=Nostoc punctiforme (strain ATCC 29133 / PCC 73102) TaxID=63737 RepID=B2IVN9_NOSP7|nr:hypothetical protein [Nostoc punctiforme]ACC82852.1 hypothetical protein Npun_F4485 [Nostoc punctiforme PCC 73102]